MIETLKMLKSLQNPKIEKIIAKKSFLAMKKILLHKNLEIATLRPITTLIRNNLHFVP